MDSSHAGAAHLADYGATKGDFSDKARRQVSRAHHEIFRGRLIDHIHLRARDLDASKRFYRAALEALGKSDTIRESPEHFSADELWIDKATEKTSSVHLAFQAPDRNTVGAFTARR